MGHKLALRQIGSGEEILKYGSVIGRATQDILPGEHVHVHNVQSLRGRGTGPENRLETEQNPKFVGYRRPDGRVGTRNYVGVLSTVVCANEVARGIAGQVKGAVAFNHQQGCCQTSPDLIRVTQTLCGLGQNPNLAAVVLVSLGCEGTDVAHLAPSPR